MNAWLEQDNVLSSTVVSADLDCVDFLTDEKLHYNINDIIEDDEDVVARVGKIS